MCNTHGIHKDKHVSENVCVCVRVSKHMQGGQKLSPLVPRVMDYLVTAFPPETDTAALYNDNSTSRTMKYERQPQGWQ